MNNDFLAGLAGGFQGLNQGLENYLRIRHFKDSLAERRAEANLGRRRFESEAAHQAYLEQSATEKQREEERHNRAMEGLYPRTHRGPGGPDDFTELISGWRTALANGETDLANAFKQKIVERGGLPAITPAASPKKPSYMDQVLGVARGAADSLGGMARGAMSSIGGAATDFAAGISGNKNPAGDLRQQIQAEKLRRTARGKSGGPR